jgi:hypothetical protein
MNLSCNASKKDYFIRFYLKRKELKCHDDKCYQNHAMKLYCFESFAMKSTTALILTKRISFI